MKRGFSLAELIIVLAVIASIIAVSTPLALNAIRKARATAVASDFKTLSSAISSSIYLGDGLRTNSSPEERPVQRTQRPTTTSILTGAVIRRFLRV